MIKLIFAGAVFLFLLFGGCVREPTAERFLYKCDEMVKQPEKDYCYLGIALETGNSDVCARIEQTPDYRMICLAATNKDFSACNQADNSNVKGHCQEAVAVALKDSSLCEQIESQFWKDLCYLETGDAGSLSTCSKIEGETEKDVCYMNVAVENKDLSICGSISSVGFKDACYRDVAIALEDLTICENITASNIKWDCEYGVKKS